MAAMRPLSRIGPGAQAGAVGLAQLAVEFVPGQGDGGVVGGLCHPRAVVRAGDEGDRRDGHGWAAPALLGGLAGDAEPGADLGPGVAEARAGR